MQEKYININKLKVSESLSRFVKDELLKDTNPVSGETIYSAEGATTPETLRQKDRLKHNTLERD